MSKESEGTALDSPEDVLWIKHATEIGKNAAGQSRRCPHNINLFKILIYLPDLPLESFRAVAKVQPERR